MERHLNTVGLVFSSVLHLLVLGWTMFNSFWSPPSQKTPSFLSVDVVTISAQTQAPSLDSKAPSHEERKKQPLSLTSPSQAKKIPVQTQEKPIVQKPLVPQKVLPKKEVSSPKLPTKKQTSKKDSTFQKSSENAKKIGLEKLLQEEAQEQKTGSQSLDSLLSDSSFSASTGGQNLGPPTTTEKDLILSQIHRYWNMPDAIKGTDVKVVIDVFLTKEGKVKNFLLVPQSSTLKHPLYTIVLETAGRALNNPAFHIPLSPERYEVWKELRLTFEDH